MAPPIYYPYDYHIAIILITAPVDLYGTNPQTSGSSPEPLGSLEDQQRQINDGIQVAKKRVKEQGLFKARFWANSCELETVLLQRAETERKISLRDFEGTASEWNKPTKHNLYSRKSKPKRPLCSYTKPGQTSCSLQKRTRGSVLCDGMHGQGDVSDRLENACEHGPDGGLQQPVCDESVLVVADLPHKPDPRY